MNDSKIFEDPNFLGWLQRQDKTLSLATIVFLLKKYLFLATGARFPRWYRIPPAGVPSFCFSQDLKHQHDVSQSISRHWPWQVNFRCRCVGCHWFYFSPSPLTMLFPLFCALSISFLCFSRVFSVPVLAPCCPVVRAIVWLVPIKNGYIFSYFLRIYKCMCNVRHAKLFFPNIRVETQKVHNTCRKGFPWKMVHVWRTKTEENIQYMQGGPRSPFLKGCG